MLAKTRQTNEKLIMAKTKSKGVGYVCPESLSKTISQNMR